MEKKKNRENQEFGFNTALPTILPERKSSKA
jgi:hypothetical protein